MASERAPIRGSRWLAALVILFMTVSTGEARAQPNAADKETARSLLNEGDRKREAKDLKGALAAYQAADALVGVPTTAIEVAKTEERLGMLVEARDTALRISRLPVGNAEPRAFQQARAAAERLASELSERVPSIRVKIQGAPVEQVTIEFDGTAVARPAASMPRKVNPGKHVVAAYAEGYERASIEITIAERETRECELWLTASREASSGVEPASGGPARGESTPGLLPTPPRIAAVDPEPAAQRRNSFVYVGASIAAAGLLVGTVSGAAQLAQTGRADTTCASGQRDACLSQLDNAHRLAAIANVSFAVGAVGVMTAILALVRSTPNQAQAGGAGTSLQLSVQPGAAGIAGTF